MPRPMSIFYTYLIAPCPKTDASELFPIAMLRLSLPYTGSCDHYTLCPAMPCHALATVTRNNSRSCLEILVCAHSTSTLQCRVVVILSKISEALRKRQFFTVKT